MSITTTPFSIEHLLGNVDIPRNVQPRLIGHLRRNDPDGGSSQPYFPSLAGTSLNLSLTKEVGGVVTPYTLNISFTSNNYQTALNTINAADPTNVDAQDVDGFIAIRNKNAGKSHFLTILAPSTAATILGLDIYPQPAATSVAGEVASSPPNRDQKNPSGTVAIAKDEDLNAKSFNRALLGLASRFERIFHEQDREIIGGDAYQFSGPEVLTVGGVVALHLPSNFRIPLLGASIPPIAEELSRRFLVTTDQGEEYITTLNAPVRITHVVWGNAGTVSAVNTSTGFSQFSPLPTPTAFSIYQPNLAGPVSKVVKIPSSPIASIRGDIVTVPGASFSYVMPGDTAVIEGSTINAPFNHNGEYIVTDVINGTTVRLRAKGTNEPLADSANVRAPGLNQGSSGVGSLKILVGSFLNGPGMIVLTDAPASIAAEFSGLYLRFAAGARPRAMVEEALHKGSFGRIGYLLQVLARQTTGNSGTRLIGGEATFDLAAGTLRQQLDQLAGDWMKLDRDEIVTGFKQFIPGIALGPDDPTDIEAAVPKATASGFNQLANTGNTVRDLIFELGRSDAGKLRLYTETLYDGTTTCLIITFNAQWIQSIAQWLVDVPTAGSGPDYTVRSAMIRLDDSGETKFFTRLQPDLLSPILIWGDGWPGDDGWSGTVAMQGVMAKSFQNPSDETDIYFSHVEDPNAYTSDNAIKAWARIEDIGPIITVNTTSRGIYFDNPGTTGFTANARGQDIYIRLCGPDPLPASIASWGNVYPMDLTGKTIQISVTDGVLLGTVSHTFTGIFNNVSEVIADCQPDLEAGGLLTVSQLVMGAFPGATEEIVFTTVATGQAVEMDFDGSSTAMGQDPGNTLIFLNFSGGLAAFGGPTAYTFTPAGDPSDGDIPPDELMNLINSTLPGFLYFVFDGIGNGLALYSDYGYSVNIHGPGADTLGLRTAKFRTVYNINFPDQYGPDYTLNGGLHFKYQGVFRDVKAYSPFAQIAKDFSTQQVYVFSFVFIDNDEFEVYCWNAYTGLQVNMGDVPLSLSLMVLGLTT